MEDGLNLWETGIDGSIKSAEISQQCLILEGINITAGLRTVTECTAAAADQGWPFNYYWLLQTRLLGFQLWPFN